jgi:hypothetical protein
MRHGLLDYLVGPEENRLRDGNIERVCRFRIYDQLKLRRPLNRQGGRFGTLENAVNVVSKPMVGLCEARSVSTKSATEFHALRYVDPPG